MRLRERWSVEHAAAPRPVGPVVALNLHEVSTDPYSLYEWHTIACSVVDAESGALKTRLESELMVARAGLDGLVTEHHANLSTHQYPNKPSEYLRVDKSRLRIFDGTSDGAPPAVDFPLEEGDRICTAPLGGLFVSRRVGDGWELEELTAAARRRLRLPFETVDVIADGDRMLITALHWNQVLLVDGERVVREWPAKARAIGLAGDLVVLANSDGVWGESLVDGQRRWQVAAPYPDALTVGDCTLVARRERPLLWASAAGVVNELALGPVLSMAVLEEEDAVLIATESAVVCIGAPDGAVRWEEPLGALGHLAVDGRRLYARRNGVVVAFDFS